MPKALKDIAKHVNGELVGDGEVLIKGVNGINEAGEGELAFILNSRQEGLLCSTKASAVIAPKDIKNSCKRSLVKVDDPSVALSKIIELIFPDRIPHPKGIHPTSIISKKSKIGKDVAVGAYVFIDDGASVGDSTLIYPFCYIGKNTNVGRDCIIYPNVTIREEISIGDRVIIHPGSVVGSDGFGYDTLKDGTHYKIPQLGTVIIEDDVEIGACVTIDRARFNKTIIGKGTKIDNLAQIAHNVVIGANCLIAAQSGVSGSCELGRSIVLGGQVGVADHIKLGDNVVAGAQSGITKSFPANTVLFGYPAKQVDKAKDTIAHIGLLPKLFERVKALEAKIKELEK